MTGRARMNNRDLQKPLFPELDPFEAARINRAKSVDPCEFTLTLSDGTEVRVEFEYIAVDMGHFNLYGEVSETGYRSCFPYERRVQSREELEAIALKHAEAARFQFLTDKAAEERKRKRTGEGK
jgi:hypothetical protein